VDYRSHFVWPIRRSARIKSERITREVGFHGDIRGLRPFVSNPFCVGAVSLKAVRLQHLMAAIVGMDYGVDAIFRHGGPTGARLHGETIVLFPADPLVGIRHAHCLEIGGAGGRSPGVLSAPLALGGFFEPFANRGDLHSSPPRMRW
jgi:hypothetical protein